MSYTVVELLEQASKLMYVVVRTCVPTVGRQVCVPTPSLEERSHSFVVWVM